MRPRTSTSRRRIKEQSAAPREGDGAGQAPQGAGARPQKITIDDSFRPRLASGLDLIGEYKDSGFKEPPYIARRKDGQTVQLSQLLYAVAEACDGRSDFKTIASQATQTVGRELSADNAKFLVIKKLIPLGVVALPDGRAVGGQRADPMLALKFRAALVPEGVVAALTRIVRPLFWPPVVIGVLIGLVAVDAYVFWFHGIAQGLRQVLYQPALMLLILGLIVVSTAFHEIGHATACAYGGAKPGVLGAGIYIIWPAFYSDVTDAYRLDKAGRLRTDLGGVYFNTVFMLVVFGVYLLTHYEPLLVMLGLQNFEIIHQFLPFLRLDGYYVIADLTGVPDLFGRVKPILKSVMPGEEPDRKVTELKGWVRLAVTGWVFLMVPIVLYIYAMLIIGAPRVFATAWDSLAKQWGMGSAAVSHNAWALVVLAVIQAILLVLPTIGIVMMFIQTGRRVWTATEDRPVLRVVATSMGAVIVLAMGTFWVPRNHNYTPIQPNETGTVPVASLTLARAPSLVTAPVQPQQLPTPNTQSSPEAQPTPSGAANSSPEPSPASSPNPSPSPT